MGTGSGSPAPVGKHRPGNFKPQVWEYSPRVRGCALQSGAVGRTSQRLHPLHHCCCPHSVRYYTWQMQSWEREKKMLFFPLTNTQVRVSHCSEVQQINFTCLTECRSAFCHCWWDGDSPVLPLGQSPGSPAPLRKGTHPLASQEQEGASSSTSASPADTTSNPANPSPHAFGNATETAQRSQTTKPSTGGDASPSRPLPATALGWPFSFYFSRGDFPEGNYNKKK